MMENTFERLSEFLEKFGDEVEGRTVEPPPPEVAEGLKAFAAGELPEADRRRLTELLKEHPRWVAYLAEEAKSIRERGAED